MNNRSQISSTLSWLFAVTVSVIGLVNTFWGNDPGFGILILLLSLIYFPPVHSIFKKKTGISIPGILKVLLALFIIWASVGVGELFDKVDLMMMDLKKNCESRHVARAPRERSKVRAEKYAYAIADSPFSPFRRTAKILQQDPNVATGAGNHSIIHEPHKRQVLHSLSQKATG